MKILSNIGHFFPFTPPLSLSRTHTLAIEIVALISFSTSKALARSSLSCGRSSSIVVEKKVVEKISYESRQTAAVAAAAAVEAGKELRVYVL